MGLKLAVKAPNQKYDDQLFNVEATWSVKQLKTFLSNEYPSKPAVGDQRLIYSGHLLKDDQALQQVFQPLPSNDSVVTIHLVCAQKATEATSSHRPPTEAISNNTQNSNPIDVNVQRDQMQSNLVNNSAGLFTGSNVSHSQSQAATAAALTSSILAQMNANASGNLLANISNPFANALIANSYLPLATPTLMPPAFAGPTANLSPEEISAVNQLYSRLLAGNANNSPPMVRGFTGPFAMNPHMVNGQWAGLMQFPTPQQQQQQPQQPQPQVQAPNQQAPLQAPQAVVDDDEADNRDWLDMFHWVSRALVLFSIVYFYSSITRFILVITFALFLYFYQTGFFAARNQQFDRQERPANAPPVAREPAERPLLDRPADENDRADIDPANDAAPDLANLRARRRISPVDPHANQTSDRPTAVTDERSSSLRMIWLVISSLFTSLIPDQPQVNLN